MDILIIFILLIPLTQKWSVSSEILSSNLSSIIPDPDVEHLVQDFGQLCEGTPLCKINVTVSETEPTNAGIKIPCCGQCRCDDDCQITDDCCPDIIPQLMASDEVKSKYDNVIKCIQTKFFPKPLNETYIVSYKMVSKCPSNNADTDTDLKEMCEQHYDYSENSKAGFADIVPVTDECMEITYKNIHCATCHGLNEDKLVKWKTEVLCAENKPFIVDSQKENAVKALYGRTDCQLTFYIPDALTSSGSIKRCDYLIDRCNITGLFSGNSFLERACASYTSVYKHYKNIHCYLCNGNSEASVEQKCLLKGTSSRVGFIGIFTFGEIPFIKTTKNSTVYFCGSRSMYDKYMRTCLPLVCSAGMLLSDMRCVPYYAKTFPASYQIRFRLVPRSDQAGIDKLVSLKEGIEQKLRKHISGTLLNLCKFEMFASLNLSEKQIKVKEELQMAEIFQVEIQAIFYQDTPKKANTEKELSDILRLYSVNFTDSDNFTIEYIVDENGINKTMSKENPLEFEVLPPTLNDHFIQYISNKNKLVTIRFPFMAFDSRCSYPIPVSYLQRCAKVLLSNDSFYSLPSKLLEKLNTINDVMFTADKQKIILCAEKYFKLLDQEIVDADNAVKGGKEEPENKPTSSTQKIYSDYGGKLVSLYMIAFQFLMSENSFRVLL